MCLYMYMQKYTSRKKRSYSISQTSQNLSWACYPASYAKMPAQMTMLVNSACNTITRKKYYLIQLILLCIYKILCISLSTWSTNIKFCMWDRRLKNLIHKKIVMYIILYIIFSPEPKLFPLHHTSHAVKYWIRIIK